MASEIAQAAFVDALASLYRTWLRMACLPADLLVLPPAEGHTLSKEISDVLDEHKTKTVADLIKRMPYIHAPPVCPEISPNTRWQDYWSGTGMTLHWEKQLYRPDLVNEAGKPIMDPTVEPGELPLTQDPRIGGSAVVIDTTTRELTARIFPHGLSSCTIHDDPDTVAELCSTVCKGRKKMQIMLAVDLIRSYEQHYLDAEWMPHQADWFEAVAIEWDIPWINRYASAFNKCGWPESFDCTRLKSIKAAEGFYNDDDEEEEEDDDDDDDDDGSGTGSGEDDS